MVLVYFVLLGAAGFVVWKKWFQKAAQSPSIRTQMTPFHTRGDQAKPHDLLEELANLNCETLQRKGGYFEFYPNQKVVAFLVPPSIQIYCHCNLMQYMDLTGAIEKKVLYGINP